MLVRPKVLHCCSCMRIFWSVCLWGNAYDKSSPSVGCEETSTSGTVKEPVAGTMLRSKLVSVRLGDFNRNAWNAGSFAYPIAFCQLWFERTDCLGDTRKYLSTYIHCCHALRGPNQTENPLPTVHHTLMGVLSWEVSKLLSIVAKNGRIINFEL